MTTPSLENLATTTSQDDLAAAFAANLTPEKIDAALLQQRAQLATAYLKRGDLAKAFEHFHFCITGMEISPYVRHIWLPEFIWAYENNRAVMLECHRSAGKSYFMPIWVLFLTWIRPVGSTQFVRISDGVATETDKSFVTIIEKNPGWKMIAPNIVPDPKGWSSDGRNLWDNTVDYGEWTRLTYADHGTEPSLLCAGITSGSIIGKHPSNGQWFDDLHDEVNTRSAKEMQQIVDVIEKNLSFTWIRPGKKKPTLGCACTFWSEKDGYHAMLRTGLFKHVTTPIFVYEDDQNIKVNGEKIPVTWLGDTPTELDLFGKRIRSLWHDGYPASDIRDFQERYPVYFPMMFLCDLDAAKGRVLKREWLAEFPAEKIGANWPTYIGIDFASTEDRIRNKDTDFFALSIWRAVPGGGAVLVGGFRDRLGSQEAIDKTRAIANMQNNLAIVGVEKWGKGEVFLNQLLFSSNLPIIPYPLQGAPVRSKGQRFQSGLAPLFTTGRAWISDVHDDFIDSFIGEWISWDGGKTSTGHDDCLDGAYWGAMAAQGHLMPKTSGNDLPNGADSKTINQQKTRKALSFGDM